MIVADIRGRGVRKEVELRVKSGEADQERIETYSLNYLAPEAKTDEEVLISLYTTPHVGHHVSLSEVRLLYTTTRRYLILREELYDKIMRERESPGKKVAREKGWNQSLSPTLDIFR